MKNTTELARDERMDSDRQSRLIRRLAHDLRQPLSNIECIGYYLDMVMGDREPELHRQCETLRRMVQQAHWMLEDASLEVSVQNAACGPVSLAEVFDKLDAEMALHDQRSLELRLEGSVIVTAPAAEAAVFCGHVLSFLRNVGQAVDPIRVTAMVGDNVTLEISAEVPGETDELLQMVGPGQGGGLHAFVEAAGGAMRARVNGRRLTLSFWLRRGE